MKKSSAKLILAEMKAAGINFVATLPDSGLGELYWLCRDDPEFQFVPVQNEGEGVAVVAGAWLGGKRPIMLMEASGLRVASEALARLGMKSGIPALLMISYRGSIGDGNYWAINQGVILEPLLKALHIPYSVIESEDAIGGCIQRALKTMDASKYPVAILMSGGTLW